MKKRLTIMSSALFALANVNAQFESDSLKVYSLGNINVVASKVTSSQASNISMTQIKDMNRTNLTEAVNLLPGLTVSEAGARNEGALYLRGFSMLQVPIFYDGIPIYVPYDGNVDISRFTTFDFSKIQVSKGFTSTLYGANTLGGAINIVSRKPVEKFEADGMIGTKYGRNELGAYSGALNIGSAQEKYYVMGSFTYIDNKYNTMSKDFVVTDAENGTLRNRSAFRDIKASGKFGFTPNATDEYSVNVIYQKSNKQISPSVSGGQYRDYPDYNKYSVYYKSTTKLFTHLKMNLTAFYDNYYNVMDQYDDDTYTLQNTKKAFHSIYDDYSTGGSLVLESDFLKNNSLRFAFHEKYDSHREKNGDIKANEITGQTFVQGEPWQNYRDNTLSIGVEDAYDITKDLQVIAGANYNYRSNIKAQEYGTHYLTGDKNVLYDFPTGTDDAFNYQLGIKYEYVKDHHLSASAGRKTHFASQKDRYSSKFGSQMPNPDLKSETGNIYDITMEGDVYGVFQYSVSVFRNELKDAIYRETVGVQDNGDPVYFNVNVGKAIFQGYEVSLGYSPVKSFTIGGNYSFIHRENKYDKDIKYVGVPDQKVVAYAKYTLPFYPISIYADMESNSKRYVTSDGETLPGFTIFNAKISCKVTKNINIEIGGKNLSDKNYSIVKNYPREGSSFYTNLVFNI